MEFIVDNVIWIIALIVVIIAFLPRSVLEYFIGPSDKEIAEAMASRGAESARFLENLKAIRERNAVADKQRTLDQLRQILLQRRKDRVLRRRPIQHKLGRV